MATASTVDTRAERIAEREGKYVTFFGDQGRLQGAGQERFRSSVNP
jgi:hypothetical protein